MHRTHIIGTANRPHARRRTLTAALIVVGLGAGFVAGSIPHTGTHQTTPATGGTRSRTASPLAGHNGAAHPDCVWLLASHQPAPHQDHPATHPRRNSQPARNTTPRPDCNTTKPTAVLVRQVGAHDVDVFEQHGDRVSGRSM